MVKTVNLGLRNVDKIISIMKNVLLLVFFLSASTGLFAQTAKSAAVSKINWLTLEEAEAMSQKAPRKIVVDVYTEWCGPCKMMMSRTFNDPALIKYVNDNFYMVKFNGEGQKSVNFGGKTYSNPKFNPAKSPRQRNAVHEFTLTTGLRGYPTLIVYNSSNKIVKRIVGFQTADKVMRQLKKL